MTAMKKIYIILIIFVIYIGSCIIMYDYMQKAYSKNGRWEHISPKGEDLFIVFFPVANTIAIPIAYIGFPPVEKEKQRNLENFFNVKK